VKPLSRPVVLVLLVVVACAGFLLRLHEASRLSVIAHPDEIFQSLEPAHRLAFGCGVITWEWRDGIRSWVLPALLAGVMRCTQWMGHGSTGYLIGVRCFLVLLSMVTVWFGYVWGKKVGGTECGLLAAAACAIWYELVGYAPRALYEVVAVNFLLIAMYLGDGPEQPASRRRIFLAGLFFGIALSFRVHLAPAILFGLLYCAGRSWQRLSAIFAGAAVSPVIFGIVDVVTGRHAFQSFYRPFQENIVQAKAQAFGTSPWYGYFPMEARHLGPLLLLAVLGMRRNKLLGGVALAILISHSMIAHKLTRFVYPATPILVVLAAVGLWELMVVASSKMKLKLNSGVLVFAGFLVFAVCTSLLAPHFSYWRQTEAMSYFHELSQEDDVCGVAVYGVPWPATGGYTYLHHSVAIILPTTEDFAHESQNFNFVVASQAAPIPAPSFIQRSCRGGTCLYQRPGPCGHQSRDEINAFLSSIDY